jgi:exopolyphosphatase/guanosine-5'-triphosphate,3'-diphosphate pyrophosphatase
VTRVAAIDCGTNSIRLLVADAIETPQGVRLTDVDRRMLIVRLGQGVDATGQFAPEALVRTRQALEQYAQVIADSGASKVRMVATSATRDASNRGEFFAMTARLLGAVVPGATAEVISGDEEARLSFSGAVGELDQSEAPFGVVDLGGGSTELVVGSTTVDAAKSVNVGCVRLTERHLRADPPTADEVAAARDTARQVLAQAFDAVPVEGVRTWVGVAGTMTTLAALAHRLPEYDSQRIHLSRVPLPRLHEVCAELIAMSSAERAALGPMFPGRADVIGGGAIVTQVLAEEFARRAGVTELVVSEHDILDGIALSLLP